MGISTSTLHSAHLLLVDLRLWYASNVAHFNITLLDHNDPLYMMMVKETQQQWHRLGDTSGTGSGTQHVIDLVFFLQFCRLYCPIYF